MTAQSPALPLSAWAPTKWPWWVVLILAVVLLLVVPIRPTWFYFDASGHELDTRHGPYTTYAQCQDVADSKTTSVLRVGILRHYECRPYPSWEVDNLGQAILVVATVLLALFTARLFLATKKVADQTGVLAQRTSEVATRTQELAEKTNAVAERTQELARDTVAASKIADRHHQESHMPILRFDGTVESRAAEHSDAGMQGFTALINGTVSNAGQGPALECTLNIGFGPDQYIGPLGSGEEKKFFASIPFVRLSNRPNAIILHMTLTYKNLFGEVAKTEHFGKLATPTDYTTVFTPPKIAERAPLDYDPKISREA